MGGRASRRAKENDSSEQYNYEALPPANYDLELASFEESSSSPSSSFSENESKKNLATAGKKLLAVRPLARLHQIKNSGHRPISPTLVLEHLVRDTLPNLSETFHSETLFSAENHFENHEGAKEGQTSLSSDSDSGDVSDEQAYPIKASDPEEETTEEVFESDVQTMSDYQKFCEMIRPQLEKLLNGYSLKEVPFSFTDYKRLLVEYGVDNVAGIMERGLSIKYEPQVVIIQGESLLTTPTFSQSEYIPEEAQTELKNYLNSRSQSVYYVDGKCTFSDEN